MVSKSNYILLSGLALRDNNRGTAALGYGAFSFLDENGICDDNTHFARIKVKGLFSWRTKDFPEEIKLSDQKWFLETLFVNSFEWRLLCHLKIVLPFGKLHRIMQRTKYVATINGGDGFSDIYGKNLFLSRLPESWLAMTTKTPLLILPQTIGPFRELENKRIASKILKYAKQVYVRDNCYVNELEQLGVDYKQVNDLSYYMKPEPWAIDIDTRNAIGLNVSGLAFDNKFFSLAGNFDLYPKLINSIIRLFQQKGKTVYLISHSYCYNNPEENNDDLEAARKVFNNLKDKSNVVLIDRDLISPQVKYLISKMSFFVGTRMHANFAAIFSKVPVFGLAYSSKFKGAFENNGIYNRVFDIKNIKDEDIDSVLSVIDRAYTEDVLQKNI